MLRPFTAPLAFILFLGCGEAEPAEPAATNEAEPAAPEEPAEPAAESLPAGQARLSLGDQGLSLSLVGPEGLSAEGQDGYATLMLGTDTLFSVSESNRDRAATEEGMANARNLEVQRAEDLDDGWVVVAQRDGRTYDFRRARSDLGLMCSQRMIPDEAALERALELCGALEAE